MDRLRSGGQKGAGEVWVVRRVRAELSLQAEAAPGAVQCAALAGQSGRQVVAGVDLQGGQRPWRPGASGR